MGGGLVEQQYRSAPQERPGQGDLLPLPGRQVAAALGQDGVVAPGQPPDEVIGPGQPRGRRDLRPPRAGLAQRDVAGHGRGEQVRVLRHPGDLGQPAIGRDLGQVGIARHDSPAAGRDESEQQRQQRALPCPARAGQQDVLAGPDGQVDVVERGPLPAGITHADRPDHDVLPAEVGVTGRLRASTDRPGGIEDLEGALRGGGAFRAGVEFGSGVAQRQVGLGGEQQDQQRRLVADVTGQQPEADLHRDERGGQRRG